MAKLEYQNGIAVIKSKNSGYLSATPAFCDLFNYKTPNLVRGLSEYQIAEYALDTPYYSAKNSAEDFITEDEHAMRGNSYFILTVEMIHEKLIAALTHKCPYIENNKIAGTICEMILLPDFTKSIINSFLNNPDVFISRHTEKYIDVFDLAPARKYNFTVRELDCIQFLVKGASAYDIALKLGLSKRTVEFYIRNIKDKLGVNKSTEIVAKVIAEGLNSNCRPGETLESMI